MSGIQVARDANPGKIKVENKTRQTIYVRVTSYTTKGGGVRYFAIAPGAEEPWGRGEANGYEGVFFSTDSQGNNLVGCIYVKSGSLVTVHSLGLRRPTQLGDLNMSYSPNDKPSLVVHNASNETVKAFVSSFSHNGGNESWFDIGPGCTETWGRWGPELIVLTLAKDVHDRSKRVGSWLRRGEVLTVNN